MGRLGETLVGWERRGYDRRDLGRLGETLESRERLGEAGRLFGDVVGAGGGGCWGVKVCESDRC